MSALAGATPELSVAIFGLLGLLLGSFLNVVIYRLPIMMERQWTSECASLAAHGNTLAADGHADTLPERFNLFVPRSVCPACNTTLHWWNNVPVLSFLVQRGRCTQCSSAIPWRYPFIEIASAVLFSACAWHFGSISATSALAWSGFCATLLAAGAIDWHTTLLHDDLTLPLLWAGLLSSALHWNDLPLTQSVWGAALGYASLWSVYHVFKWVTGKEGLGFGDFKLVAAMGAWLGPVALIPLTLIACVLGLAMALPQILLQGMNRNHQMPFGPYLALAGIVLAFYKSPILNFLGLAI